MKEVWARLKKTKTLKVTIAGILVAIGSALGGQMEWSDAIMTVVTCLMGLAVRDGIAKK